jgi:uncharacterized protein YukE
VSRVGMNVDEVERLAGDLQRQADRIELVISQIDGLVRSLAGAWHGPKAETFAHQWRPAHRAKLHTAAEQVRGLGRSAQANATAQREVSGATGGASLRIPGTTGPAGLLHDVSKAFTDVSGSDWLLGGSVVGGLAGLIGRNSMVVGRYTNAWDRVLRVGDSAHLPEDLLRYKRSPLLQVLDDGRGALHDTKVGALLASHASVIDAAGKPLKWLNVGARVLEVADAISLTFRTSRQ